MSEIVESCNAAGDSCEVQEVSGKLELNTETAGAGEPGIAPADKKPEKAEKSQAPEKELVALFQQKLQERTRERDDYKKKIQETEAKLSALQASYDAVTSNGDDEMSLRRQIEDFKTKLNQAEQKLEGRSRLIANQECQISALAKQVSSLKEVVAITKNLLEIRNMEVKHLQEDVNSMESKISAERSRHDEMINRMNAAAKLNADLKTEYETQLSLFQNLRKKYEEKVSLLSDKSESEANNSCGK
ncbi:A-kinase anchor protein 9 [Fopius arisanus]|uniref:A-kinase anchor protein 9 n=1 Tax=Fopius arisanus TaxID=64838 RepID=A0A9R1T6P7_9HYME|nr:PREDICTED: A-kinase anchor protein 9 [Fopius arisanus]